jgi:RNA polymerase sporulation-specific sigma factor
MRSALRSARSVDERTDEELVGCWQAGDPDALELLLRRYRSVARSKARTYFLAGADADDIEQEALIGLYKAARDFRAERQTSFRAFAEVCVTRQVISAIKAATRHKHLPLNGYVSISATGAPGDGERCVEDLLGARGSLDPCEEVISREQLAAIRRSVAERLSGLEVEVLRLYAQGKTYQEIGEHLGRRTKAIDNALQRVKRKLAFEAVTPSPALALAS